MIPSKKTDPYINVSWYSVFQGTIRNDIFQSQHWGCQSKSSFLMLLKSQYLATSCEELTHWKRPWCWEGLGAGGEGDDRGWDGWMASPTQWTWVWVNSGSWWWTGRPGVLLFMGLQRVGQGLSDWTELKRKKVLETCTICYVLNTSIEMFFFFWKGEFNGK